jgi:hypothetical protein
MDINENEIDEMQSDEVLQPKPLQRLIEFLNSKNIAEFLSKKKLDELSMNAVREYNIDVTSNSKYYADLSIIEEQIDIMSLEHTGRANVKLPWFIVSAQEFAAQVYPEIVQGSEVVRPQVIGKEMGGELSTIAQRIANLMNYQNLIQNKDWEAQTDKLLFMVELYGSMFRKRYIDEHGKQCTEIIKPRQLVVHSQTETLETCPRITHLFALYPYQIEMRIAAGQFLDYKYKGNNTTDSQEPINFLEQHVLLDLNDDDVIAPYTILIDQDLGKVVRITPRFTIDDIILDENENIKEIKPLNAFIEYGWMPDWNGGFYSMGILHYLGNIYDAANTICNQIIDAGTAANNTGGFLSSAVQIKAGINKLNGREYQFIDIDGGDLATGIAHMPVREPSPTLYQMLAYIDDMFHRMASTSSFDLSRIPSNMGEMAALQMMEQGMKSYMGIFKRIYRSLREEFMLQMRLNVAYPPAATYTLVNGQEANPAELSIRDLPIIPAADPNNVANAQKAQKAQFLLQFRDEPNIDRAEINRRALSALQVENIEKIMPEPEEPTPKQKQEIATVKELELRRMTAEVLKLEMEVNAQRAEISRKTAETVKVLKQADEIIVNTDKLERETYGEINYENNQIGNTGLV